MSQQTRFLYKTVAQPGPGTYNLQNEWNKRTYNVNFTDLTNSPQPSISH